MISAPMLKRAIYSEFRSLGFMRETFPMLTDWGVRDEGLQVHSLGCNYLAGFGRHLGYWAINEYTIRLRNQKLIRPDAVWWHKPDGRVLLLAEFERFYPGRESALLEKCRNLLESYHSLNAEPQVLLLLCWSIAGTDLVRVPEAASIAFTGFQSVSGHWISGIRPDAVFLTATAVFGDTGTDLKLLEIRQ